MLLTRCSEISSKSGAVTVAAVVADGTWVAAVVGTPVAAWLIAVVLRLAHVAAQFIAALP